MNFQQFLVLPAISNSLLKLFKVQGLKAYKKSGAAKAVPAAPLPMAMDQLHVAMFQGSCCMRQKLGRSRRAGGFDGTCVGSGTIVHVAYAVFHLQLFIYAMLL